MNKFLSHVMSDELVNDDWEWEGNDYDNEFEEDWNDFDENFEEDPLDDSPWVEYDDE